MAYVLVGLRYMLLIILYAFILRIVFLIMRDIKSVDDKNNTQPRGPSADTSIHYVANLIVVNSGVTEFTVGDKRSINEMLTIGRSSNSDLIIGDNFTSGQHARIYWMKDNYWIEDLGSTNGTQVNGHKISKETMLIDRDQIKIGSVTFQFVRWEHAVQ